MALLSRELIERAITLLDEIDGDVDLEDGGDYEPYLAGSQSDMEDDPAEDDPWIVPLHLCGATAT